ncbi:MAG: hypothetical protein HYX28_05250 [Candidatus Koribacter versatilis]|uniref:Uncharacterized protein n=1 Tax=Candidatus Korobacter versatilis TaxID=658062 RepID=A0A932A8T5_9BACT|nr:hypothetical protein [Candidatus Koribacter versatilis]
MNLDNELWVAAALLHKREPEREALQVSQIRSELSRINPSRSKQRAVYAYLSDHCVANKKRGRNSIGARIFVDVGYGLRRLYRPGDPTSPDRIHGKYKPERSEIPGRFWPLLDWYEAEYLRRGPHVTSAARSAEGMLPEGRAKDWLQFVGYINAHDLQLMKSAIEEDFEIVHPE